MLASVRHTSTCAIAAVMLSACAQQQVVDPQVASSLRVTDVVVDASVASNASPRGFNVSEEQVEAVFDRAITSALSDTSGTTPASVQVSVKSVYVPNPVAGLLFGGNYPTGAADVQVVSASGDAIGEAFSVGAGGAEAAGGQFRPGILGAALQGSEEQELSTLSNAIAARVRAAILGPQG